MAKVTNLTNKTIPLLRWKVLPASSNVVDPKGHVYTSMPDDVAYSSVGKRLALQGALELEGYSPVTFTDIVAVPETIEEVSETAENKDYKKKKRG